MGFFFFLSLKWKYMIADIWVYHQYLLHRPHIRNQICYLWEAGWQRLTRERRKLLTWLKKSFSLVPHTLIDHIIFYIVMLTTSLLRQVLLHTLQVGPKAGSFFASNFMVILQNHYFFSPSSPNLPGWQYDNQTELPIQRQILLLSFLDSIKQSLSYFLIFRVYKQPINI